MKPVPPKNLWEQMDAIRKDCGVVSPPDGAFTLKEYCERYGISMAMARGQLAKLESKGKVSRWGVYNRNLYFEPRA